MHPWSYYQGRPSCRTRVYHQGANTNIVRYVCVRYLSIRERRVFRVDFCFTFEWYRGMDVDRVGSSRSIDRHAVYTDRFGFLNDRLCGAHNARENLISTWYLAICHSIWHVLHFVSFVVIPLVGFRTFHTGDSIYLYSSIFTLRCKTGGEYIFSKFVQITFTVHNLV